MKSPFPNLRLLLFLAFLLTVGALQGQTRPALIGSGPRALINMVDAQKLAAEGQKDAMVMFTVFVLPDGQPDGEVIFRESPGSKALARQVRSQLKNCRFIPALYNGKPVPVQFFGTALYFVAEGKPRFRIFANNDLADVKSQADFVAPQLIPGTDNWPAAKELVERNRDTLENGTCEAALTIGLDGHVKGARILAENPKGYMYGAATLKRFETGRFIPGFRNGKPVACTFTYTQLMRTYREEYVKGLRGSLIPQR